MRKLRTLSLYLFAITLLSISCTKEGPEGPVGAQGPQGPAGNTGLPGTNGINGTNGQQGPPGTANVIYSAWISDALATNWADTTMPLLGGSRRRNLPAPGCVDSILQKGVVLMYARGGATGNNPMPMPYDFFFSPFSISIGYLPALSRIIVYAANVGSSSTLIGTGLFWGGDFRYVIIPGGIAGGRMASGSGNTVQELRAMSYDQVLKKFNIPVDGSNQ